jgi:hypothetical protein
MLAPAECMRTRSSEVDVLNETSGPERGPSTNSSFNINKGDVKRA